MGGLVDYLDLTQRGRLPLLRPPVKVNVPGGSVQIDAATRRNLEITLRAPAARGLAPLGHRPHRNRSARGSLNAASPRPRARPDRDPRKA